VTRPGRRWLLSLSNSQPIRLSVSALADGARLRRSLPVSPDKQPETRLRHTGAMADLAELARTTLARNRFMVLGTVDPSGRPRVSPVWFSLVDHRDAYWLSSPDAHHSQNIQQRPQVSLVVFDSAADPHTGQAVYLEATAARVPDDELADACAKAFREVDEELSYTPVTLRDEPFVLYRAHVTASEIHVRGRDFGDGTGADQRVPVQLSGEAGVSPAQ
jgi:nitroimidazol reductase NimA-like FMN-containing flavoprotein (pyridoxamine 5'-phosphate oxidase superfamily)